MLIYELYGLSEVAKIKKPEDIASHFKIGDDLLDLKLKSTYYCELMF